MVLEVQALGVALALGGIPDGALPPISGLVLIVVSPLIYSVWIVLSARLAGERRERRAAAPLPRPPRS